MTFLDFLSRDPSRFDAMLLDLDGTLLLGDEPLPGAAELIALLRRNRTPFFFLTNNCSNTSGEIAARLNAAGIEAYPEDIAGAAAPLREELARKGWEKLRFFLIGSATFPEQLGLRYATDPKRIGECGGILFLGGLHDWRTSFHAVLNELMKRPELPVVIPNPDRLNPVKGGVTLCPLGQFELVRFHLRELGIEIRPLHMRKHMFVHRRDPPRTRRRGRRFSRQRHRRREPCRAAVRSGPDRADRPENRRNGGGLPAPRLHFRFDRVSRRSFGFH